MSCSYIWISFDHLSTYFLDFFLIQFHLIRPKQILTGSCKFFFSSFSSHAWMHMYWNSMFNKKSSIISPCLQIRNFPSALAFQLKKIFTSIGSLSFSMSLFSIKHKTISNNAFLLLFTFHDFNLFFFIIWRARVTYLFFKRQNCFPVFSLYSDTNF